VEPRPLGTTGLFISPIAFGAGPVPALLTTPDAKDTQCRTIAKAMELGINWFDTAATYGDGRSEAALGSALRTLGALSRVHIATKVRLSAEQVDDIPAAVFASVEGSLERLGVNRVTCLQLHNSITTRRGDLPTSITPEDVLGPRGVLRAMEQVRADGRATHFGLTGLGELHALRPVLQSRAFATIQVPYHLLDSSNDHLMCHAASLGMSVLAIRVLAGGALAQRPASEHTKTTKFFPLALYESDRARAEELSQQLSGEMTLPEVAVRFVLSHRAVTSALIGFSDEEQLADAVRYANAGPLDLRGVFGNSFPPTTV
jgi:L-galactose dehydrogenase/L-glyceraldehyde 3-phosphate reductase